MAAPARPVPTGIPRAGQNPAYRPPGKFSKSGCELGCRDPTTLAFDSFEIAALRSFQHYRRQPAAHESPGVDTDPVATIFGCFADRVPVDDHAVVTPRMG